MTAKSAGAAGGKTTAPTGRSRNKLPAYPWPTGIPTWMKTALDTMWKHGQLAIAPQIMAAIAKAESGFEVKGAGINSSGYGGYFGLGATQQYPTGMVTSSVLNTSSEASFRVQAKLADANLYQYVMTADAALPATGKPTTAIIAAVNHYVGGGGFKNYAKTANADVKVVWSIISGKGAHTAVDGGGGTTAGGVQPTHLLTIASPLSGIAKDIGYLHDITFWKRVGIFLGGVALAVVGGIILLTSDKSVRSDVGKTAATAAMA